MYTGPRASKINMTPFRSWKRITKNEATRRDINKTSEKKVQSKDI